MAQCSAAFFSKVGISLNTIVNISETDGGTEEYLWEVYDTGNGQFVIMNYAQGKFVQYDPNYSSYGSYSDERGVLPYLVLAEDPITE